MASFPTSVKNYGADLVDGVDYPQAAHVNDLRAEVTAIEDGYRSGTAPLNSSGSTVASLTVTGAATFSGAVTVSSAGLTLSTGEPAATTNTLYQSGGSLYFNGQAVGASSNSTFANVSVTGGSTFTGGVTIPSTSAIAAHVTCSSNQAIPAETWTGLSFNAQRFVQGFTHSTASTAASSVITVNRAGIYVIGGQVTWGSSAYVFGVRIVKSDTTVLALEQSPYTASGAVEQVVMTVAALSTGDTIGLGVYAGPSTNHVLGNTDRSPGLWIAQVGV